MIYQWENWYFSLIAHCIDVAEQNSWQLHRLEGNEKLDHLEFRRPIAISILETNDQVCKSKGRPPKTNKPAVGSAIQNVQQGV